MEVLIKDIAKRRKTVRKFKNKKVSIDDILYCIEVAKEAPSGMNAQPWKFLLLTDAKKKKEIRKLCEEGEKEFHHRVRGSLSEWLREKNISWKKEFLQQASAVVIVLSFRKAPYFIQSTWIAIGYFLLALEEKGLATVTYTPPNLGEICTYLKIPHEYKIEVILPIGYSDDEKKKEKRNALDEIAHMGSWGTFPLPSH